MPLYEYQCEKCGSLFETLQKYSDAPLTVHEGCGGKVEKQLSASGFQLKGGGWYVTEYGKGGIKPAAKPEGASDGKTEGKSSDAASDSKPSTEAKTESKTESKADSKAESKPAAPAAKSD